jgi:serine/threonine protein kinase/dienelactone hydrolase
MIGQTISHYKIIEELGSGGMGTVYKAQDIKLGRFVALKFLPPHLSQTEEEKKRFMHEAKAASALDHPNICNIYEIDETADGQMFIAMACYEGETLNKKIERGPLKLGEAVDIAIQIARGLEKAHKKEVVHRDIKPANIFITRDNVVKIVDFGLAKLRGRTKITKEGTTLGTASYMSPEQARGGKVDHRTDIWSFGVVLYEMLAGQLPFKGEYEQAVIYSILNENPVSLQDVRADIPEIFEKVIQKALNKPMDGRYDSMLEILEALIRIKKDMTSPEAQKTAASHIKKIFRHTGLYIPGILILLALVITIIWTVNRRQKIQWAKNVVLIQIERLTNERKYQEAYTLAEETEKVIPNDSTLNLLWPHISFYLTIHSVPQGAQVFWKEYADINGPWIPLGQTPIDSIRLSFGLKRFRIEKQGFETVYIAPFIHTFDYAFYREQHLIISRLNLDEEGSIPDEMVRIFPIKTVFEPNKWILEDTFHDFLIDKFEVTNKDYKHFVDAGGYQKKEYWKHPFIKDGEIITWERAMSLFLDKTGRPGPASWEVGDFPDGMEHFPVSGVSWYEAAAYAEFIRKELPTLTHFNWAAGIKAAGDIIQLSNFNEPEGAAPAGKYQGMGPYGTYDMAGNVREWCWNKTIPEEGRFICGGGWNDPTYVFAQPTTGQNPFDRSETNGFRCVKYFKTDSTLTELKKPVTTIVRNVYEEQPVSDREFDIFLRMYGYPKTELNAVVEKVYAQGKDWNIERISFNAAYGNERVIAFLFLPKTGKPPFQIVVYFPGSGALWEQSDEILKPSRARVIDFIVKDGRAVCWPVYNGTFERKMNPPDIMYKDEFKRKEFTIMWGKDLCRTVDYLETRSDVDASKLAYYGLSLGARLGGTLLAVEKRFQVAVLYVGGFNVERHEIFPEIDPINFLPRVTLPVLMLNGKYDHSFPYETSQKPFYDFLGTPDKDKKHYVYGTSHIVPRDQYIKEILAWLDRYLGPVK